MIVQLKKDYSSDHAFFITPPAVDETKQKYRNNKLIKEYISVLTEVANAMIVKYRFLYGIS